MRRALLGLNLFALVFSLIWFVGHLTVRVGDWEFWFSLGFLGLTAANAAYFLCARR